MAGTEVLLDPAGHSLWCAERFGDLLAFSAGGLWTTDGTAAGTARATDVQPGPGSAIALGDLPGGSDVPIARLGSGVVFVADDGVHGEEPWVSDGTAAGTALLRDGYPGSRGSEPRWLTAVGDRVFFVATDPVRGRELWATDGTADGTKPYADLRPGPASSLPQELAAFGDVLLFTADDGVHGREPWQTDGSPEGFAMVQDLAPGPLPSSPLSFTRAGAFVFFAANDGTTGFELWRLRLAPLELFADGFESGDLAAWSAAAP